MFFLHCLIKMICLYVYTNKSMFCDSTFFLTNLSNEKKLLNFLNLREYKCWNNHNGNLDG